MPASSGRHHYHSVQSVAESAGGHRVSRKPNNPHAPPLRSDDGETRHPLSVLVALSVMVEAHQHRVSIRTNARAGIGDYWCEKRTQAFDSTSPEELGELYRDDVCYVEWEVASNIYCPPDILQELTDKVLKYEREDRQEAPYVDLHLFKERIAENPSSPPGVLQALAWEHEAHLAIVAHPSVTAELLHLMVSGGMDDGCDCWDVEAVVGMHPLTAPETLGFIASQISNGYPSVSDLTSMTESMAYEPSIKKGTRGQSWCGPLQVLVAVICHRDTDGATRQYGMDAIEDASKFERPAGHYPEGFSRENF